MLTDGVMNALSALSKSLTGRTHLGSTWLVSAFKLAKAVAPSCSTPENRARRLEWASKPNVLKVKDRKRSNSEISSARLIMVLDWYGRLSRKR